MMFTELPNDSRLALLTDLDSIVGVKTKYGRSADWRYSESTGALNVAVPPGKYSDLLAWARAHGLVESGGKWHLYYFAACNGEPAELRHDNGQRILWAQFQPAEIREVR